MRGHQPASVERPRDVDVPSELGRFNWAAFVFPIGWAIARGQFLWALLFSVLGALFGKGFIWIGVNAVLVAGFGTVPPPSGPLALAGAIGTFGLQVWYGANANRLAWNARPWLDPRMILDSERKWTRALLIAAACVVLLAIVLYALDRTGHTQQINDHLWVKDSKAPPSLN